MTSTPFSSESGSAILRSVDNLTSSAGRLEALLNPGDADARFGVLVCHPHPLGGGTMHNKVVYHTMKVFQSFRLPVLRFNFRGTGLSQGEHDNGRGEVEDVHAALDWLEHEFGIPILFAGFSFGSNVGLRACCGDSRVKGISALGLPVRAEGRDYQYPFLSGCTQPKLFVSGAQDAYGPRAAIEAIVAAAAQPAELAFIEAADHFFAGKLPQMQAALRAWVKTRFLTDEYQ